MSDVYIARQPIFDKDMNLFGYELLYRRSQNNFFEGTNDEQATAALIDNSFFIGFNELIDGTRGFINFSQKLLLDEIPFMLPKDNVVVEILERVEITGAVVEVCRKLKSMGYMLALDDFILSGGNKNYAALLELVDIIKVEYSYSTINEQLWLLREYKDKITFLAERVETAEDYKCAISMGYSLFQGFFFSKPIMFKTKEIGWLDINLILILKELYKPEPDIKSITGVFERDLGLAFKLLRIANSVHYGVRYRVKSIQQALVCLGTQELIRWIHLMLIKGIQNVENSELVKTSLIRGRTLALLAVKTNKHQSESDYFITGIFSSIDVLLNEDMKTIINKLPLKNTVSAALLGENNTLRRLLNAMLDFEQARWDAIDMLMDEMGLVRDTFVHLYLDSIKWQQSLAF